MPPMDRKTVWGGGPTKPPGVGGTNGAIRGGDSGKRSPKDGVPPNMARKPHNGGAGQQRGGKSDYSEEVSFPPCAA
jgi:hypothetical protein